MFYAVRRENSEAGQTTGHTVTLYIACIKELAL